MVMRSLAAQRWRGQVPARLARELVPRVDELPAIERRALLDALTQHHRASDPARTTHDLAGLASTPAESDQPRAVNIRIEGGSVGSSFLRRVHAALPAPPGTPP